MASQKDKDYHKLRNPKKYGICSPSYPLTSAEAEASKAYNKLWYKFGGKSMVGDKRRRGSTRKGNQKVKAMVHQIDRARGKQETRKVFLEPSENFELRRSWGTEHGMNL